jgi:WD40 repeat protein
MIPAVTFSPDGTLLVTGYGDGMIALRNVIDGSPEFTLQSHDAVKSIAFDPGGTMLASGHYDGTVRLWGIPANE